MAKTDSNVEVVSRRAMGEILAGRKPERVWDPDTPGHGGNHVLLGSAVRYALAPDAWREERRRWYAAQERAGLYGPEAAGGYRGYWLEGWLMDLRTARLAGHEDVATAALGAIRARVALETLCETSAGRAIVPGARVGDPWRGKWNDMLRRALRDGAPLPAPKDRFWKLETALGALILRDLIARDLVPELPLGADERWLPRLAWGMTIYLHANGVVAEIPIFTGRIEGAPCWSITAVGDEVVDVVDWRVSEPGKVWRQVAHKNLHDARAPRPPHVPASLGAHVRTVRWMGPGSTPGTVTGPPAPPPPPEPPEPPKPKPPTKPKPPEPPGPEPGHDFVIPESGLRLLIPQGDRSAEIILKRVGRWRFVEWHEKSE